MARTARPACAERNAAAPARAPMSVERRRWTVCSVAHVAPEFVDSDAAVNRVWTGFETRARGWSSERALTKILRWTYPVAADGSWPTLSATACSTRLLRSPSTAIATSPHGRGDRAFFRDCFRMESSVAHVPGRLWRSRWSAPLVGPPVDRRAGASGTVHINRLSLIHKKMCIKGFYVPLYTLNCMLVQ